MENKISKTVLGKVIWIPSQFRGLSPEAHVITRHALKLWDQIHKKENWVYNSPLIPLKDTQFFPPGVEKGFGKWLRRITSN